MADAFNKVLSEFCKTFTSIKKRSDLTIHGTGMDKAMRDLGDYTKNDKKLYNREMDIMTPLWNALGLQVPANAGEQVKRAEKIKACLDNLAKHRLIVGSVFVGVGTAKYWNKMSEFCLSQIINPIKDIIVKTESEMILKKRIIRIQEKLSEYCKAMQGKSKEEHNKDAQHILDLWGDILKNKGEIIRSTYNLVGCEHFESIYKIILGMVKTNSSLLQLVKNNGSNVSDNVYWNLLSAIKDVQRNWNNYKK